MATDRFATLFARLTILWAPKLAITECSFLPRRVGGRPAANIVRMGRRRRPLANDSGAGAIEQQAQAAVDVALQATDSTESHLIVRRARTIGSLWAGYGTIMEAEAGGEKGQSLIIKQVSPPCGSGISHERKLRSYAVEAAFYQRVAIHLPSSTACHVPLCLGVHSTLQSDSSDAGSLQLVMTDLRQHFPNSCASLDERHAVAALSWLAAFHAACWGADAEQLGLWPEGCYWHLHTRLEELVDISHEWRALQRAAHDLDGRLRDTPFRTLTHGDFKTENLLFSASGSSSLGCAAYDFQYVGGGSPMKDVAYLFASGVSPRLLQQREESLLRLYHSQLMEGLATAAAASQGAGVAHPSKAAEALERYDFAAMMVDYKLAVCDYVRFMAGWGFWGNSSWAAAQARRYLAELGLQE